MREGILAVIGNTPLVRLKKLFAGADLRLFAKLESFNPGGSSKDRPALAILESGILSGAIGPDTVIMESSSGNMGIGLAQACRYHGLRFICVVDPKSLLVNVKLMKVYGGEVDLITVPDEVSGEFLQARIDRVHVLMREIPNSFWPNQYANPDNAASHYRTTMAEIAIALDFKIDFLFVGTSTCGTISGCTQYVRDHGLKTRIVAVDAAGSRIFGDQPPTRRLLPGLGAAIRPPLCDLGLVDEVVYVTDVESIVGCRRLVRREAILAGGSSGGVLAAVDKFRVRMPAGATCVAILPDRGERYLETIYNDSWVREHFGEIEHLYALEEKVAIWQTVAS